MARSKRFKDSARIASVSQAAPETEDEDIEVVETPEEAPAAVKEPETPPQVEVEIENDEEKPLDVLRRQLEEVAAERDSERKRSQELENRSRQQQEQLNRHQTSELGHHKAVLEQAYAAEELKLEDIKRRHAEALSHQDYRTATETQLELTRTDGIMRQYASAYAEIERYEKQPRQAPQQVQQDPFEQAIGGLHPRVAAWAREHKDDVLRRQQLAISAGTIAEESGLKPGDDDYMEYIDSVMGYDKKSSQPKARSNGVSKRPIAAPVSRSSSGSSTKVYLNQDDKRQARQLNMSDVEYAKFKLKANEGQGGPQTPGMHGRLHARYTASGN